MSKQIPLQMLETAGSSLYASERKVYPRDVDGRFQRLRNVAVVVLLGLFYGVAWLRWDGRQAVLFDLPARKFYVFGLGFWPQDFLFLALLLIIAALALFFFTAIAGRLWCGYACPQTVWTEVFLKMERWTEGDRGQRMKLDAAPWGARKLLRKSAKHALWIVFALWTGFTFVGYFSPITDLAARTPWSWSGWETFWILFYAFATWGNAGFMREQVCKYMCPYARFQSAMFDRNTLIIAYDAVRGERRGPRKRGFGSVFERARASLPAPALHNPPELLSLHDSPESLGDCIDCTICVQVCPTGIDIRDGLQYECIACGACVDACNEVMDKVGYPRGLIRHSTQNAIDARPTRVLRPRVFVYGLLLLTLCFGWAWGVMHRSVLIAEVLRDRNSLYRVADDGRIENGYTLKIINKEASGRSYRLFVTAPGGITLTGGDRLIAADAEEVLTVPVTLSAQKGTTSRSEVVFHVETLDRRWQKSVPSSFFGPTP